MHSHCALQWPVADGQRYAIARQFLDEVVQLLVTHAGHEVVVDLQQLVAESQAGQGGRRAASNQHDEDAVVQSLASHAHLIVLALTEDHLSDAVRNLGALQADRVAGERCNHMLAVAIGRDFVLVCDLERVAREKQIRKERKITSLVMIIEKFFRQTQRFESVLRTKKQI